MYRFKKILVGLVKNEDEPIVLHYAGWLSRIAKPEKMIFLHAHERPDSSCLPGEYAECFEPQEALSRENLEELARKSLDGHPEMVQEYRVVEGEPLSAILRIVREEDIDLVIVGRKTGRESNRKLPLKLARKAPCSVWVIPEGAKGTVQNVLVPSDFSEHSKDAAEIAASIASAENLGTLSLLHVFKVPIGYHKSGKTYAEFTKIMRKNARNQFKQFHKGIDFRDLKIAPTFVLNDSPAKGIQAFAKRRKADLIVIGAKGRSLAALVMLGSVTEKLIETTRIPILAVKKKGEGMGFLEALMTP